MHTTVDKLAISRYFVLCDHNHFTIFTKILERKYGENHRTSVCQVCYGQSQRRCLGTGREREREKEREREREERKRGNERKKQREKAWRSKRLHETLNSRAKEKTISSPRFS